MTDKDAAAALRRINGTLFKSQAFEFEPWMSEALIIGAQALEARSEIPSQPPCSRCDETPASRRQAKEALWETRSLLVMNLRGEGKTWKAIGEALGISTDRVRQIGHKAERIKRRKELASP